MPWLEDGIASIGTGIFTGLVTSTMFWELLGCIFLFEILWGSMQRAVYRRIT